MLGVAILVGFAVRAARVTVLTYDDASGTVAVSRQMMRRGETIASMNASEVAVRIRPAEVLVFGTWRGFAVTAELGQTVFVLACVKSREVAMDYLGEAPPWVQERYQGDGPVLERTGDRRLW
jgi:hypothetical protein